MKSKFILALLLVVTAAMGLSCTKETPAADPVKLDAPVLTLSENVVTWASVKGAVNYLPEVNGVERGKVAVCSYDLSSLGIGNYTVRVKAIGDGTSTADSDWSASVTHSITGLLAAPVLSVSGYRVSWSAVEHATAYEYKINGGMTESTEETSVDLSDEAPGEYVVTVRSTSTDALYGTSEWSEEVTVTIKGGLMAPVLTANIFTFKENVAGNRSNISWEPVENATGYEVAIDGRSTKPVDTHVSVANYTGHHSISVKAVNEDDPVKYPASEETVLEFDCKAYGNGSEETPYTIHDATDWADFADMVSTEYSFSEKYVKLENDVDFDGAAMAAAGVSSTKQFAGIFDGCGKKLSNAVIGDGTQTNQGIFPCASGTVINLVAENITVNGSADAIARVAVLAAGTVKGTFRNCTVRNCTVSAPAESNCYAGIIAADVDGGTIENCTAENCTLTAVWDLAGGIAGCIKTGTVNKCKVTGCSISARRFCGGLVGLVSGGLVINSISDGNTVTGSASYVGGLVGQMNGNGACINNYGAACEVAITTAQKDLFLSLGMGGDVKDLTANYFKNNVIRSGKLTYTTGSQRAVGIIAGRRLSSCTLQHNYYPDGLESTVNQTDPGNKILSVGYNDLTGINTQGGYTKVSDDGKITVETEESTTTVNLVDRLNENITKTYVEAYPSIISWTTDVQGWPVLNF